MTGSSSDYENWKHHTGYWHDYSPFISAALVTYTRTHAMQVRLVISVSTATGLLKNKWLLNFINVNKIKGFDQKNLTKSIMIFFCMSDKKKKK